MSVKQLAVEVAFEAGVGNPLLWVVSGAYDQVKLMAEKLLAGFGQVYHTWRKVLDIGLTNVIENRQIGSQGELRDDLMRAI